jgi:Family of unknown function (DUF5330)
MLPASVSVRVAKLAAGDTDLMFFLLRIAFWLSIVLILLPSGSTQNVQSPSNVDASEAISAASATVADMRGFCTRQPDACSVGSQVAVSLGYRAQAGAKMLYEFLTEKLARHDAGSVTHTGSITKTAQDKSSQDRAAQNTLIPADLTTPWRGPLTHKDPKPSA